MVPISELTIKAENYPQKGRVCLIQPPTLTSVDAYGLDVVPPLGLAYIAGALKNAGCSVTVVDAMGSALDRYSRSPDYSDLLVHGMSIDQVITNIDANADVIGVSSMFSNQWLFIRDLLNKIKETYPDKFIVLGGEHPSSCPEYILESCPAVDACVLGEGEETIIELVDAVISSIDLKSISGIVYRDDNDQAVQTTARARIRAIDEIAEPDWSIFPIERYIDDGHTYGSNIGRTIPILASRGCPFQCTFCSSPQMWTTRWVARKPEILISEMKKYIERYNVTNFDFYDLTAIVKKEWIADFCQQLLAENISVTWQLASGTRSEAIDCEITKLMSRAGCRLVIYAPESGSIEELSRIKKKVKLDNMLSSMRASTQARLETKANIIFGMLGMTWKDVFHSMGFIARVALVGTTNMAAYPFSPYPGSEDFAKLVAENKIALNDEYFMSLLLLCRNLNTKNTQSFNEKFSPKTLSLICSIGFLIFYGISFTVRPWRPISLAYANFIKKDAASLLTLAFTNVRRKKAAVKIMDAEQSNEVVLQFEHSIGGPPRKLTT